MSSLLYREEQQVRESLLPLILIPSWIIVIGIFVWGFYSQLVKGKPWGDNPMSDSGLLITGVLVIVLMGGVIALTLMGKLVTEVHKDGFYYYFPPYLNHMKRISLERIRSARVRKFSRFSQFSQKGIHFDVIRRQTSFSLNGNKGVEIILDNGRRFLFGTHNLEEMGIAIQKMMEGKVVK
jgi:hypothetical protein